MCMGLPGRIVSLTGADLDLRAEVDFGVSVKTASLATLPDAAVDDWVVVHSGFVVRRLSREEAAEAAAHFRNAAASGR